MDFLGRRLFYCIALACYFVGVGQTMSFLNTQYDTISATEGSDAALRFAAMGLGGVAIAGLLMTVLLALRLRNAGRSGWWALCAFVPIVNLVAFAAAAFMSEDD